MNKGVGYVTYLKQNERGLTLIEILAVIVILAIISTILINILFSASKQNVAQTNEAIQTNNAAYVLKQVTKDLRKTHEVTTNNNDYIFINSSNTLSVQYSYSNRTLYRNNAPIAMNIDDFLLEPMGETITISFRFNGEFYTTTINLRKGDF